MPALRAIDSIEVRHRALEAVTKRFNVLGWGALMLLVLTGIDNVIESNNDFNIFDFDIRYAWIMTTKLTLVGITTALTFWHTNVIGPQMMDKMVEANRDEAVAAEYQSLRKQSIALSVANFLVGLGILFAAALLGRPEFSLRTV
jgi:uncharacterized membrane protein